MQAPETRRSAVVRALLGAGDDTAANPGSFANVCVEPQPPAECAPGELMIQVCAAAVGYPDLLQTVGGYQHRPALPYTPGSEAAGIVRKSAGSFRVGDRVAVHAVGCMSSQLAVPADSCWRFPTDWSFAEAAGFGVAYQTAYHCLVERAALQPGELLLVTGAAGGVGLAAVQIGKRLGAVVVGAGGSDDKLRVVKRVGADYVINYSTTARFNKLLKRLGGAAVVLDTVGRPTECNGFHNGQVGGAVFDESLRGCGWGARVCVVGFTSGTRTVAATNYVLIKGLTLLGCRAGEAVRWAIYSIRRWTVRQAGPGLRRDSAARAPGVGS